MPALPDLPPATLPVPTQQTHQAANGVPQPPAAPPLHSSLANLFGVQLQTNATIGPVQAATPEPAPPAAPQPAAPQPAAPQPAAPQPAAPPLPTPVLSITKTFEFAAAHQLPRHNGQCRRLHGHNYRLEVTATGHLVVDPTRPDDGMVMDFGDLKGLVAPLLGVLDHYSLNTHLENPTAEWLCVWLMERLPACVTRVVVHETSSSYATLERPLPAEPAPAEQPRKRRAAQR